METQELKILLAVEPRWTVSLNGMQFMPLASSDVELSGSTIRFGDYSRQIVDVQWLRPNSVRIHGRSKFRTQLDTITFYPGDRLPSSAGLRRKRRTFQADVGRTLRLHFGVRKITHEALYSDRRHGIGGAYPRFLIGNHAVITVDPDESSAVVNGVMRAALLWAPLVRRPVSVLVPRGRHQTIASRLRRMTEVRHRLQWLEWDGSNIEPLNLSTTEPETHVHEYQLPDLAFFDSEVRRICSVATGRLQAVPHIGGNAVSIRFRGLEVARVSRSGTEYPYGDCLGDVVDRLDETRRPGSNDPLARAHEERWLESKLVADICQLIPSIDVRHVYPQVPSFVGEERNIIDLLAITTDGRLVVIEIKASPDPDLPFQALDYWIAVERHRKAGDFQDKGYFAGCVIKDEPALLVLVAPLLAYHKTARRLIGTLPSEVPLLEIGINETWKTQIKILRRKGLVS